MEQACKSVHKTEQPEVVVSGKYTYVFSQEAQKQHCSENGPRGHDRCVHVVLYTSVLNIHCHRCIAMLARRVTADTAW
eukprot:1142543-Pelagomonas_calceolata.AAC.9